MRATDAIYALFVSNSCVLSRKMRAWRKMKVNCQWNVCDTSALHAWACAEWTLIIIIPRIEHVHNAHTYAWFTHEKSIVGAWITQKPRPLSNLRTAKIFVQFKTTFAHNHARPMLSHFWRMGIARITQALLMIYAYRACIAYNPDSVRVSYAFHAFSLCDRALISRH